MASMQSPRMEHSTAVLLTNGKVYTGGGDARLSDYQIYAPPYIFCGSRPVITIPAPTAPAIVVSYNGTGSVTHSFDQDQRYQRLEIVAHSIGTNPPSTRSITFKAPPSSRHAPAGYYMLFLVTNQTSPGALQGVPSEAVWVQLK